MRRAKRKIVSTPTKKPQIKSNEESTTNRETCKDITHSCLSLPVIIKESDVEEPCAKKSKTSVLSKVTKPLKNNASKTSISKKAIRSSQKKNIKCPDVTVKLSKLNLRPRRVAENKKVKKPQVNPIVPKSSSKPEVVEHLKKLKDNDESLRNSQLSHIRKTVTVDSFNRKMVNIFIDEYKITYECLSELNSEFVEETEMSCREEQDVNGCEINNNQVVTSVSNFSDSISNLDGKPDFIDFHSITPDVIGDEKLKSKEKGSNESFDSSFKLKDSEKTKGNDLNYLNKHSFTSLQDIVDKFMKNPQLKCVEDVNVLKKGLCFSWLANNYVCFNQNCGFRHNACKFFIEKLKKYPSKFVMVLTVSMRRDDLFVDIIMAAFKVLSERQAPIVWITFLVYFVFYLTEPSDSRFLKFWANAARFFCQFNKNYSAANGYASLLSIFSQCRESDERKIIEFVKLITEPPIQMRVTYVLLQPILKMNIPIPLLAEAVESCLETQEDVLRVYLTIIPKLPLMTVPVYVVELLLRLCETLEKMDQKTYAQKLKQRLRPKVQTLKTKILGYEFPLSALFQQELARSPPNDEPVISSSNEMEEFRDLTNEHNYFDPKDQINLIYDVMIQAVALHSNEIPCQFRKTMKPPTLVDIKNDVLELVTREKQIDQVKHFFNHYRFDLLEKYLNELRDDDVMPAAEEFLKLLFRTKISLKQVVNLMKIILFSCKTQNSAKVFGCISKTLILNLIRINEWEKAYTLVSMCHEKQINIIKGKVFCSENLASVTQFRVALVLVEIHAYKQNYQTAMDIIKKYYLYSANRFLWNLPWNERDGTARIKVLEEFLCQIVSHQLVCMVLELFELIWKEQAHLDRPVDLRKLVNEVLILLLNHEFKENALNLYNRVKSQVELNESTIRVILVTLVRYDRLIAAKSLLVFHKQRTYVLPDVSSSSVVMEISNYWLEEEIYIMFDGLFDLLAAREYRNIKSVSKKPAPEVLVNLSTRETSPPSVLAPSCLGFINPSFKHTRMRIERVLKKEFTPPVSILITPTSIKLDGYSLQLHLNERIRNHMW